MMRVELNTKLVGIALALALSAASAAAHEFWIEPSTHTPSVQAPVRVALRVGEAFAGEPVARDPAKIERFYLVGAGSEHDVPGQDGQDPAGFVRLETAGTYQIVYRSRPTQSELDPEIFEAYLKEEGMEYVLPQLAERGLRGRPAREAFSRCAKAVLCTSDAETTEAPAPVGLPLELVLERHPGALHGGGALPVQLLHDGKPVSGAMVRAWCRELPGQALALRSDAQGRVQFDVPRGGTWLIATVHMTPAPEGVEAEWESRWASVTFQVPAN